MAPEPEPATREPAEEKEPGFWNVWQVLSLVSLLFAIAVAVAEYLGLFRDLGVVLTVVGIGLSIWFGLTASTQRTGDLLRFDIRRMRRDVGGFEDVRRELVEIATILRDRLPGA